MSFNETNFVQNSFDAVVVTDEQDVDEFQRFQDDVQKAIEPLENQIVLHESVHPSWMELLRQAGHETPPQIESPQYSLSPTAYAKSKPSFVGVIVGGVVGGVLIGSVISALGTERLHGVGLSVRHSVARLFEASPKVASQDKAPTHPVDETAQSALPAFASRFQPAEQSSVADQPPSPPQTAVSVAVSPPTDTPPPPATEEKAGQSSSAEDASSSANSDSAALPANVSEAPSSETAAPATVPTPPSREASAAQIDRDKPQTQPAAKRADKPKALRRRRVMAADASTGTSNPPPRPKRGLGQSHRGDQAASLRVPAR
jgi:hypothetical protein